MNNNSSDNPYLNKIKTPGIDQNITEAATKTEKNKPNIYALVGLCLAAAGTLLCFINRRATLASAGVAGLGAAGSLIGLMIDVKRKVPGDIPAGGDSQDNWLGRTVHHITNSISDNMSLTIETAPWFYACILFLLLAGVFCFLRLKRLNT